MQQSTLRPVAAQLAALVRDHLCDDRLAAQLRESIRVSAWVKRPALVPAERSEWVCVQDLIRIRVAVDRDVDVDPVADFLLRYFSVIGTRDTTDSQAGRVKSTVVPLPLDAVPRHIALDDAPIWATLDVTTSRNPLGDSIPVIAGELPR